MTEPYREIDPRQTVLFLAKDDSELQYRHGSLGWLVSQDKAAEFFRLAAYPNWNNARPSDTCLDFKDYHFIVLSLGVRIELMKNYHSCLFGLGFLRLIFRGRVVTWLDLDTTPESPAFTTEFWKSILTMGELERF